MHPISSEAEAVTPEAPAWRSGYRPDPERFDEWFTPDGKPRPALDALVASFDELGCAGLDARHESARRALRENGVTYNVYGDPAGVDRVLRFDPAPLVIGAAEWKGIEAGLLQRTRLLNAVLADLYGPQRVLKEGILPGSVVFGGAGYQPACHGLRPSADIWLHLHAVDLARSPDGRWWALADRAQAPSGAGYALESRVVLSRLLPDEMRRLRVRRFASFFRHWREGLAAHAPAGRSEPRIVILTPGPLNETYFEHAYLSRYLGFALVQGDDLTVRDDRVFLKTLEGLQPVDVIVRRVDDGFCDPLELRADSFLGVPGLLEVARAGGVTVANAIGSGLAESPALLAFLPPLCRFLLGEELLLPSVATWWCGQPLERAHVLEHLDTLVLKGVRAGVARQPVFGADLTPAKREELTARITRQPWAFLGQEAIACSAVPVWGQGRLAPRQVGLRAYIARGADGWKVMPGGLTRVSPDEGSRVVSMQSGGAGKDTWVLADRPVAHASLIAPVTPLPAHARSDSGLPSRVADHLFWLGRYAERLEDLARLLRCILGRLAGEGYGELMSDPAPLAALLATAEWPVTPEDSAQPEALRSWLIEEAGQSSFPGGLQDGLLRVRRAAWMVRERLSGDTWRILGELQTSAEPGPEGFSSTELPAVLDRVILYLCAFSGMEMEDMTRDFGWRFLDFGRRLERAVTLLRLAAASLKQGESVRLLMDPLLEIADSTITYRRRYFAPAMPAPVLDLLLLDDTNPRSVAFQFRRLQEHLEVLARLPGIDVTGEKQRLLTGLFATLRGLDLERRAEREAPAGWVSLAADCEDAARRLCRLSDLVTGTYFAHAGSRAR